MQRMRMMRYSLIITETEINSTRQVCVVPIYIAQNKCANDRPNKHNQLFEKTVSGCSNSLLF